MVPGALEVLDGRIDSAGNSLSADPSRFENDHAPSAFFGYDWNARQQLDEAANSAQIFRPKRAQGDSVGHGPRIADVHRSFLTHVTMGSNRGV